ncbi:hypothetical protein ACFO4E_10750 [Nocardiopsis mangrovi]|uniref:Uncharacterized protein n=1 Tax=Nocardiopsis mangrovi TaxID=1179818 RepID=A0ABV9DTX8_9ACTN
MPDPHEEDITSEDEETEKIGEEAPSAPLEGAPASRKLHDIMNIFADSDLGGAVPPMIDPDNVTKIDWFVRFRSDQKSPDELTHWLESGFSEQRAADGRGGWSDSRSAPGSSGPESDERERVYYSGIAFDPDFSGSPAWKLFFDNMSTILDVPLGHDGGSSTNYDAKNLGQLSQDLYDLQGMLDGRTDDLKSWWNGASDALSGATADVFVGHLGNLLARFRALRDQVSEYPDPIIDARNSIIVRARNDFYFAFGSWAKDRLFHPSAHVDKWFKDNKDIATVKKGDDSTQIGDIGPANDPNTWTEIQNRIQRSWRDHLNEFSDRVAQRMDVFAAEYDKSRASMVEITRPASMPLDWSGAGGGGGGGGGGNGDGDDLSDIEKEYNDTYEDWLREQIEWMEENPPGGGGGDDGDSESDGSEMQDRYNEALDDYYRELIDELDSGPTAGGDDLGGGGDGGGGSGGSGDSDAAREYEDALDDYYRELTEGLDSGPTAGGDDLGGGGDGGGGSGGSGDSDAAREYEDALDDYYRELTEGLDSGPTAGGDDLGGGGGGGAPIPVGGGGGSGDRRRPSDDSSAQAIDDYYDQATGDLDRLMADSPDPDGDGRNADGEALTPAEQEYQRALDEYSRSQREDLEQLASDGPDSSGGDLGGDGYEQRLQEYYDEEMGNLDRLVSDVDGITDENGDPAPELDEYRQQVGDYYDQRTGELDDLLTGPESGGGDLGGGGSGGGDGSSAQEYQERLNEYYDQQAADLDERMNAGPESGGGDLGGGGSGGGDGSSAQEYQERLNEYYDQQAADLDERMNAGPAAGGGGLGGSLGRGGGEEAGGPPPSYSIGDGWSDPRSAPERPVPDANGIRSGGGDLRGGSEAFTGAVGNGNGNGQGGGEFSGLGGGGMGGMGGGGMPPMMPPMGGGMGGMGGAGGQGENARTRTSWMSEDERVWGTGAGEKISVLGRPGSGDVTKGDRNEQLPAGNGTGTRTSTGGPGEPVQGKRKPGLGNRRGRLQGSGDQRDGQR